MDNQTNIATTYELNQLKSVIRAEYKEWLDIPEREVSIDLLANALIRAGYQEVHKYISEIEHLKSECEYRKKQYDNQVEENTRLNIEYDKAFERLKAQQREIEQLKAENEELSKVVSSKVYDLIDNAKEIADAREAWEQQAKIDVLNELKEKCKFDGHTVAVYKNDIEEMIKELTKCQR